VKTKFWKRVSLLIMVLCVVLSPVFSENVKATEVINAPVILLEKYAVTNEQIVPGEDFTLTLFLKNCSGIDASGVMVDIINPEGIMPVYGTVSQVFVGDVKAGESVEVNIDYIANTNIDGTCVDFNMTIIVGSSASNYVELRVPAGMDVPFSVLSEKFPETAIVGENVTSSLAFEVLGDENVRSVVHTISTNGTVIGSSTLGTLTPGTTRTQNTAVGFTQPGIYTVDIEIQYVDKTDQVQTYLIASREITVYEKANDNTYVPQDISGGENDDANFSLLLGLSGIAIVIVFLVIVVLRKKK